jgi:hypothetical protein
MTCMMPRFVLLFWLSLTPSFLFSQHHNPFLSLPVHMTSRLPADAGNRIVVVSTRNFDPDRGYKLKRGLQPSLRLSWFTAAGRNDTSWVQPVADPASACAILPANRDFLVYVDGHGKTFSQVLERGFELSRRYGINVVVFDWPTDYVALRKTAHNADEVAVAFVRAMRIFSEVRRSAFSEAPVSVIFHSMGNRIAKNLVDQRLQSFLPSNLFDNVILNAAAVKQQRHAHWIEKLHIQQRIYITINDEDRPLKGATLLRLSRQLGRGITGKKAVNAVYVDFSAVAGTEHNLFLGYSKTESDNPLIFRFYSDAFHGREVPADYLQTFSPSDKSLLRSERY